MSNALQAKPKGSSVSVGQNTQGFVTMRVGNQLVGIAVLLVRDVLRHMQIAPVPLSQREVAGLMNLRGRIVTVIDMRKRLNLPPRVEGDGEMHAVVEYKDEAYSLQVDSVGDVVNLPVSRIERTPANLDGCWKEVAAGVFQLEEELLVVLDVQALLNF